ncbi:uncharacterized protein L969DRAFT_42674 [Mixia osmundae IAM 14324]|uniref:AB hydrolase-1 domain-containing protein n=1 Tax=Mixia osmundae (strain CBS 9802 / IAM 14324 / JCM 22182 / KY 12970) TaxID=764103 RepID=G7DSS9_MIXOS|nr:uncharacterized protein L969DRAFT_42674 [Mixia osmundae IAM 14324]KEI41821.1 hypothetical protein L969DRAFT_42674 [Mixia osmundae IAM 14324]GAA93637.1 hypothetical protein E5Q_00281 [Mixia osmundae IAM 14324]
MSYFAQYPHRRSANIDDLNSQQHGSPGPSTQQHWIAQSTAGSEALSGEPVVLAPVRRRRSTRPRTHSPGVANGDPTPESEHQQGDSPSPEPGYISLTQAQLDQIHASRRSSASQTARTALARKNSAISSSATPSTSSPFTSSQAPTPALSVSQLSTTSARNRSPQLANGQLNSDLNRLALAGQPQFGKRTRQLSPSASKASGQDEPVVSAYTQNDELASEFVKLTASMDMPSNNVEKRNPGLGFVNPTQTPSPDLLSPRTESRSPRAAGSAASSPASMTAPNLSSARVLPQRPAISPRLSSAARMNRKGTGALSPASSPEKSPSATRSPSPPPATAHAPITAPSAPSPEPVPVTNQIASRARSLSILAVSPRRSAEVISPFSDTSSTEHMSFCTAAESSASGTAIPSITDIINRHKAALLDSNGKAQKALPLLQHFPSSTNTQLGSDSATSLNDHGDTVPDILCALDSDPSSKAKEEVARFIRSSRLTRLLQLECPPHHGLTISLADVGVPEGHPVLVFLGLGAVRYLVGLYDELAQALGLRLICVDRWGLGRSSNIPVAQRGLIPWTSVMVEVLDRLDLPRVSLLAHSAGAPYCLATSAVLAQTDRLSGSVHLLAPWVAGTPDSAYRWLKYVPSGVIRTAQAAEWHVQTMKLGKPPEIQMRGIGYVKPSSSLGVVTAEAETASPRTSAEGRRRSFRKSFSLKSPPSSPAPDNDLLESSPPSKPRRKRSLSLGKGSKGRSMSRRSTEPMPEMPTSSSMSSIQSGVSMPTRRTSHKAKPAAPIFDTTEALIKASHAESQGSSNDLLVLLDERRPKGFEYAELACPVKIWYGEKDDRIPVSSIQWLAQTLPRVDVSLVPGADHNLMTSYNVLVDALESIASEAGLT